MPRVQSRPCRAQRRVGRRQGAAADLASPQDAVHLDLAGRVLKLQRLFSRRRLIGQPAAIHQHGGRAARDAQRDDDMDAGQFVVRAVTQHELLANRKSRARPPAQVGRLGVDAPPSRTRGGSSMRARIRALAARSGPGDRAARSPGSQRAYTTARGRVAHSHLPRKGEVWPVEGRFNSRVSSDQPPPQERCPPPAANRRLSALVNA